MISTIHGCSEVLGRKRIICVVVSVSVVVRIADVGSCTTIDDGTSAIRALGITSSSSSTTVPAGIHHDHFSQLLVGESAETSLVANTGDVVVVTDVPVVVVVAAESRGQ